MRTALILFTVSSPDATQWNPAQRSRIMLHSIRATMLLLVLGIVTSMLNACGWHLRGTAGMKLTIAPLYVEIQKGSTQLRNDLRDALRSSGATLVDKRNDAEMVLVIHDEQQGRRVLSVGSSGKVSDYELQYTLTFSVLDKIGNQVLAQDSISQQRDYSFDETAVLSKSEEEHRLFDFMRRMSIQGLMRRLQALNETSVPASDFTIESTNAN